jgi:L-threonylcarbamoyladenylate synthase
MDLSLKESLEKAIKTLRSGGVIAYPTESVFGLGCDPFNSDAVSKLLQLKHRPIKKGFILIASEWSQVESLIEPIEPQSLARVFSTWPGPITWTFPASENTPIWIHGEHKTVAIRLTSHPIARAICDTFGGAIISTSANIDGFPPARNFEMLTLSFSNKIDTIIPGELGELKNPTKIRDAVTGEILRPD